MKLNNEDIAVVEFMHDRLLEVYKEKQNVDYLVKARKTTNKMYGIVNGDNTITEPVLPLQSVSGWAYIKKHLKPILIGFATGITLMTVFSLIESIVLKIALIIHGG